AVTLKWPNDVLVAGKKIGGLLLEGGQGWLVIGVGLNVEHYPKDAMYPATSLSEAKAKPTKLAKILDLFLERLGHWHDFMQARGFAPVRAAWLSHAEKGQMSVRMSKETLTGTFKDVDDKGNLHLILANSTERAIATGDVFVLSKKG